MNFDYGVKMLLNSCDFMRRLAPLAIIKITTFSILRLRFSPVNSDADPAFESDA